MSNQKDHEKRVKQMWDLRQAGNMKFVERADGNMHSDDDAEKICLYGWEVAKAEKYHDKRSREVAEACGRNPEDASHSTVVYGMDNPLRKRSLGERLLGL